MRLLPADKVTRAVGTDCRRAELAVGTGAAERLHLVGGFDGRLESGRDGAQAQGGRDLSPPMGSTWECASNRAAFWGFSKDHPATWYGGAHIDPGRWLHGAGAVCGLSDRFGDLYCRNVLVRVESLVDQITFVVRFLAGFSIFAGLDDFWPQALPARASARIMLPFELIQRLAIQPRQIAPAPPASDPRAGYAAWC